MPVALGKSHLSQDLIEEGDAVISSQRSYGRGVVEEASQWQRTRNSLREDGTRTDSESSESAGSSETGRSDMIFNFSKQDVILIVDDNLDVKSYIRSMLVSISFLLPQIS